MAGGKRESAVGLCGFKGCFPCESICRQHAPGPRHLALPQAELVSREAARPSSGSRYKSWCPARIFQEDWISSHETRNKCGQGQNFPFLQFPLCPGLCPWSLRPLVTENPYGGVAGTMHSTETVLLPWSL